MRAGVGEADLGVGVADDPLEPVGVVVGDDRLPAQGGAVLGDEVEQGVDRVAPRAAATSANDLPTSWSSGHARICVRPRSRW